jgi:predicted RNA binding protein YcfA (HicA-like mRNA interferase family)
LKLPRDVNGLDLAKRLEKFGYSITRQTGSHIRLTTNKVGEHHITIPAHKTLKIDTLNGILHDISEHLKITKDELIAILWE